MARQTLTKTTVPGPNPTAGTAVTWTAANPTDKEQYAVSSGDVLLIWNTGGSAYTYTITSVADPTYGRTGDIAANSIAAGDIECLRLGIEGWRQTDGKIYLEANNAAVKFAVLTGL